MDRMQAPSRGAISGLLADAMFGGLNYMKDPRRTQQMQGLAAMLESTGVPAVVDRVSYGEPLTTGRGMTTKLRPEAENTLMAALGMIPMGKPAIMATKGLPVGMSIKDVGKVFPTSITSKSEVQNVANDFADQFKQMGFDVTLDHSGSKAGASSYLRVSDPQTGRFLSKPIRISDHSKGAKELDANINILNPQEDFAKITSALNDMRAKGDTLVFKQDKYAQELIANGIKPKTAYQRAKTEVAEVQAPQEEALRLAQQRAALPVEKGGLGLPKDNTAMDRAKAMGGKDQYHFSRTGGDYETLDSGQYAVAPFDAVGTHVGTKQAAADRFKNTTATTDQIKGTSYPVTILGDRPLLNQNDMPFGEDDLNAFLRKEGGHTLSDMKGGKMTYQDMNASLRKKLFEEQGYTSIPYFNEVEGKGSISYIVPPDNIRSRFAAFDPFRRNAAIASAMGVAAPNLLAAEQEPVPEQNESMIQSLLKMLGR
jgi:hypothetical protein